jgi:class 3 adenylate cyclase/tetratricopeptide (TPR) repeat protein
MTELPSGTVTFLFTDVQDSSRLWEQYPAAMNRALAQHDDLIESLARQHNGTLVRPRGEGDSRFVVFVRALDGVVAAAAIQQALNAESWPEQIPLCVRMALHTGEGEFRSGDYYGMAVNRCARLRSIAHGGQTLVSHSTYELVRDVLPEDLEFHDLGEHPLKGLKRPERVFQLAGPDLPADFSPLVIDHHRLLAPLPGIPRHIPAFLEADSERKRDLAKKPLFVARERDLEWLNGFLEKALDGNGNVVFVVGGPGRGKTALISEFSRRAVAEHATMLGAIGNCHAYSGVGDPYLPFREVMGMLTGDIESHWISGTIPTRQAQRAWNAVPIAVKALLDHGPHLPGIFVDPKKLMSRALSASDSDASWLKELHAALNRQQERSDGLDQSHLFEQYTNVLRNLAEQHPLLLILDDMQWADSASAGLLFHLGRRLEGAQILIVCAYRPEEVALGRPSNQFHAGQIERHPLDKVISEFKRKFGDNCWDLGQIKVAEERSFVDAFLDSEPNRLRDRFRKALFSHTAGHPLFTIELLHAMQERGDLVQDNGFWVDQSSLDWNTLPARIEGVIDERLNRLEEQLFEILTVASVEGVIFTPKVLARVQSISDRQLLRQLSRELENRHRLVKEQEGVFVGQSWLARYRFSHVLFQQHIYNNTSEGERRILHQTIGEILEELYKGHEGEIAVQLIHHFAGDRKQEQRYARLAGEQAARQFANHEALVYFCQALALTAEDDYESRYKLQMAREAVYNTLGERDLQKEDLEEIRSTVKYLVQRGKGPGWAEVETRWARYTSHTDYHGTAPIAERAVSLAKSEGKLKMAVESYLIWSNSSRIQGEYAAAVQQVDEGITIAREIGDLRGEGRLLNVLGLITLDQKDPTTARIIFEQALAIAREIGERLCEAQPLNSLGNTAGSEGDYSAAQSYFEQALKIARETGNRRGESLVLGNLGWVVCVQGDFRSGEAYYDQQRTIALEIGDRYIETYTAINLCMSTLTQGDCETALKYAQQGLDLAGQTGDRSGKAWSLTYLGHIYVEMGELSKASAAYQASFDIRNSLKQHNLTMEPQAGLARVSMKQGDISAARKDVGDILNYLDGGGSLDGTEEPLRVWFTCYSFLQVAQDSRAISILENAHTLLMERAGKISDQEMRQKFIENIPFHSKIVKVWQQHQG